MEVNPSCALSYPVQIGQDLVSAVTESLPKACSKVALITDDNVARLHGKRVAEGLRNRVQVEQFSFQAGEINKTRATKEQLEDQLIGRHLDRDSVVIGLGGGAHMDELALVVRIDGVALHRSNLPSALIQTLGSLNGAPFVPPEQRK